MRDFPWDRGWRDGWRRTGFESNRRLSVFIWRENFVRHLRSSCSPLPTHIFGNLANLQPIT